MSIPETYLKHYNLKLIDDEIGWHVLLPFLVLDVMQQIFYKEIAPLKFKHEMKHAKNVIAREYKLFNSEFWSIFSHEQQDEIIDIMDSFTENTKDSITIARIQVMNEMTDLSLEQQNVCAAMDMINILAKSANIFWSNIFSKVKSLRNGNPHISAIEFASRTLFKSYFAEYSNLYVNQNDNDNIVNSMNVVIKRMVDFVKSLENTK